MSADRMRSRRTPHLLRVTPEPAAFAPLFAALAGAGMRAGWLDLDRAEAPPASLDAAAALGAARAVAVGAGRSVAVKALRGAPVLRDLLREHFAGCALVLVAGAGAAAGADMAAPAGAGAVAAPALAAVPALSAEDGRWRLAPPGAAAELLDTAELAARLRRPRPWS